jgi:hypothetical protein
MIYGELDRYPLDIDIKLRIIAYWTKLIIPVLDNKILK